jgi:uncharacterized protein YecT (DUF1311 family)
LKDLRRNERIQGMKLFKMVVLVALVMMALARTYAQSEATQEADAWFRKADAEMNQAYKTVMKKLTTKRERAELVKAQKAWSYYCAGTETR